VPFLQAQFIVESASYRAAPRLFIRFLLAQVVLKSVPFVVLSATPDVALIQSIRLAFHSSPGTPTRVFKEFTRPWQKRSNFRYETIRVDEVLSPGTLEQSYSSEKAAVVFLLNDLLPWVLDDSDGSKLLVYVKTNSEVQRMHRVLKALVGSDVDLCMYSGSNHMNVDAREAEQRMFSRQDSTRPCIMVANSAFGMGVDITGITAVLVVAFPFSLEMLRQMWGRGGRSGEVTRAVLLAPLGSLLDTLSTQVKSSSLSKTRANAKTRHAVGVAQVVPIPGDRAIDDTELGVLLPLHDLMVEERCLRPYVTGTISDANSRCRGDDIACSVCAAAACAVCGPVRRAAMFPIASVVEAVVSSLGNRMVSCNGTIVCTPPDLKDLTAKQAVNPLAGSTSVTTRGGRTELLSRDDIIGAVNDGIRAKRIKPYWVSTGNGTVYLAATASRDAATGYRRVGSISKSSRCGRSHSVCVASALDSVAGSSQSDANDLSQASQNSGYGEPTVRVDMDAVDRVFGDIQKTMAAEAKEKKKTKTNKEKSRKAQPSLQSLLGADSVGHRCSPKLRAGEQCRTCGSFAQGVLRTESAASSELAASSASPARSVSAGGLPSTPARATAAATKRQLFTAPMHGLQLCACDPESNAAGHCLSPHCIYAGTF
jgi:hypothetical protein